jgi:hypothetical protein
VTPGMKGLNNILQVQLFKLQSRRLGQWYCGPCRRGGAVNGMVSSFLLKMNMCWTTLDENATLGV